MATKGRRRVGATLVGVLLAVPAQAQAQDLLDPASFSAIVRLVRWSGVLTSVLLILFVWFLLRLLDRTFEGLSRAFNHRRLLLQKVRAILYFVIYVGTAGIAVLLSFELRPEVLALVGGGLAVGLGFATKDLVASFISGLMILFDQPFQVGDRVAFGGEYGDVTRIGLRSVRIRTLDDNIVTVPNNLFLQGITACGNYGALEMQVVVDFFIGIDQDFQRAMELVRLSAVTCPYTHLSRPVVVLLSQEVVETYFALRVRLKVYVHDTRNEKKLVSDVTIRTLKAFRAEGIGPPAILERRHPPAPLRPPDSARPTAAR